MLPGAAARRSERVLEHELQGQILNFCAAEARAADAVFYLSHLIQLPCLRLGQRGPVAELIASRLLGVPPRLCVCAASSSSSELHAEASFLVDLLVVPTPTPALDPIRLPGIDVTGGLLPPANPLPRDLLVLWAEAGAREDAVSCCLLRPGPQVRNMRRTNAALRSRLVEVWRRVASLENREGAFLWELGCLRVA